MPNKYTLSEDIVRAIEKCLANGNAAEVKIEHSAPIVVEIKRKLMCKSTASSKD